MLGCDVILHYPVAGNYGVAFVRIRSRPVGTSCLVEYWIVAEVKFGIGEGVRGDIDVDTVIMSLGTSPNPLISMTTKGLDTNKRKCIVAEENTGKTSREGVYAGGDAVTGAATVISAMGAGKLAAKSIDEYLSKK